MTERITIATGSRRVRPRNETRIFTLTCLGGMKDDLRDTYKHLAS